VQLTDATPSTLVAETNCAGNFFVQAVDWTPVYPVHAAVTFGDTKVSMRSHIGRATSCATCHTGTDTSSSVVHVYLTSDPMTYPPTGCP
jgi:cytochrome c553